MASSSAPPNTTLYLKNLNDKVNKEELRAQLFALFMTYGKIVDVVAQKGQKMRGQAFLVFTDLAEATSAMRACEGMIFYDKPMHIEYARAKSYATLRREDPKFVPPNAVDPTGASGKSNAIEKRQRDDDATDMRQSKREKSQDDDDDEEMELEDEEESAPPKNTPAVPPAVQHPSSRLLCTNLPQEVTDDALALLFQQYRGFQASQTTPAPILNAVGVKVKMAQVVYESPELATVAKEALDGFTLKKGWNMGVAYM